jgi:DNA-binding Lrp family transcriptional regulator
VLDSKHLGYKSSLLALRVPPEDIEMVAEFINQFPGVTHNYQRSHTYNLWFTLSASSLEKFNQIVEIIKIKTGIHDILELPAINIFQHEVKFNF